MTASTIITHLAGPLCAIFVALLLLACAIVNWRMPHWRGAAGGGERGAASDIVQSA